MTRPPTPAAPQDPDEPLELVSVWPTGQLQARTQRQGRYLRSSLDHPAKMLPAIARHAILAYTAPGEWVLDPMCGIGTTLIEAAHLDRNALGLELELKWADIATANLAHARSQGATGAAEVHTGDARLLPAALADTAHAGRAALLLTSPPYGAMTHGQVRTRRDGATDGRVDKWNHRYSATRDRAHLAHQRPDELLASFTRILAQARLLLRPGAHVVITTRPYRHKGRLVDFPGHVAAAAQQAGLVLLDRCVALLCALRDGDLVTRASFFQMIETRRLRGQGLPAQIIAHEDVLILTNPALDAARREAGFGVKDGFEPHQCAPVACRDDATPADLADKGGGR